MVETMKSKMIRARLITAMIEPIMVNQFLDDGGNFTAGDLGLTVKLNFVGQTEKINLGDIITTSGLEKDIPAGLVIGRVSQINNNQNDVWQNINIEPAVNFDNLRIVSVARP